MAERVRTAVLISGTGSNMEALVRAAAEPDYPAEVVLVISNRPEAAGLAKAEAAGVETDVIDHTALASREIFDAALDACLRAADVELVALAGFMRILTPGFTRAWEGRMVNIHPSLLPRHRGLHTHRRALEAGDPNHGATVHWVTEELDAGETIAQSRFAVPPGATEASLEARVRKLEHPLYVRALANAARAVRDRDGGH